MTSGLMLVAVVGAVVFPLAEQGFVEGAKLRVGTIEKAVTKRVFYAREIFQNSFLA